MHDKTIAEISAGLRDKTFSSKEITQVFLDRIANLDTQLNSFITVCPELALYEVGGSFGGSVRYRRLPGLATYRTLQVQHTHQPFYRAAATGICSRCNWRQTFLAP